MQASESVISVCFNSSLLKYGGDLAVGAMTILSSVMQFALLPLQGIAQGAQPITSYNYGARQRGPGAGDLPSAADGLPVLFRARCGRSSCCSRRRSPVCSARTRHWSPSRRGPLRVYCGALFLFGIQIACQMTFVSIGNAALLHHRGGAAQVRPADPADLPAAPPAGRPDHGGLRWRSPRRTPSPLLVRCCCSSGSSEKRCGNWKSRRRKKKNCLKNRKR